MNNSLKNNSEKLNITIDELIDRYIRREYYTENIYVPEKLTIQEAIKIHEEDIERLEKQQKFSNRNDK